MRNAISINRQINIKIIEMRTKKKKNLSYHLTVLSLARIVQLYFKRQLKWLFNYEY